MKTYVTLFSMFCLLHLGNAICRAEGESIKLTELDRLGQPIQTSVKTQLDLHRENAKVIAVDFAETTPGECSSTFCSSSYRAAYYEVTESRTDSCGDTQYTALGPSVNDESRLEIVDHSARTCSWDKSYRWEAILTQSGMVTRQFIGNKE